MEGGIYICTPLRMISTSSFPSPSIVDLLALFIYAPLCPSQLLFNFSIEVLKLLIPIYYIMMNSSLFSSFDAVCAEFLGHKVSASMPCITSPLSSQPQENIMNSSSHPTQICKAATQPIITPAKPTNPKLNCCRLCS